jgi:hypothetical protein
MIVNIFATIVYRLGKAGKFFPVFFCLAYNLTGAQNGATCQV